MKHTSRRRASVLSAFSLIGMSCISASAALTVIGTKYHQDLMFPEFDCYWDGGQYPTLCPTNYAGATLYVYVKNTGGGSETISDATLIGYSLTTVIKRSTSGSINPNGLNSIYFYWDNPPADILNAGEPVWWKASPATIPAGGVGEVAIRLRHVPSTTPLSVGVVVSSTLTTNITVDAAAPQIQTIAYSEDRKKVYLHWRRNGTPLPTTIYLDGTNVTSLATSVSDTSIGLAASVINLTNALSHFSFHVYQGVYADGKIAGAGQRAWTNKFIYATYGCFPADGGYTMEDWVDEASDHGFNNIQMNLGDMGGYMGTANGRANMQAHGYGYTILDPGKLQPNMDPDMWFLNDEPELVENNNYNNNCGTGYRIPCDVRQFAATLAINESVEHAADVWSHRPNVPVTVNLDGGIQPQSFYNWGPSVDILQTDNYYEPRMRNAYENDANKIPLYNNSRFTYAIGRTITAAAEPNPGHHLLYSTAKDAWPYPAWQSKRFEVYYTLAGGTRAGIGYWWLQGGNGMNNTDPDSIKLWKEVGLCGAEIKTVRDLLIKSTPLDVTITQTPKVWAKAVASGTDSMIVYVVNDNYVNASDGYTYVTNVANASVTVTLPSWMLSPVAFEVTAGGLKSVSMTTTNGNQVQFNLGTLTLTRMIVLTKDSQLPLAIQNRYISVVRPGVCDFASAFCTNSAPVIVVPPRSQTVLVNSNATFVVTATGIPAPAYQWRYNGANLSGATSATYTRTNAQVAHNGSYTVVVSNSLGMVTSAVATLTVSTNGFPPSILAQPSSQTVEYGQNATFTVTADGTGPLSYRWRFNGGTISGATTNSYTRSNAQYTDAGNYDVVITNAAGAVTSAVASLTVTVPCPAVSLLNASFEGGNAGGVATSWTGYQRTPNPTTVWSIQTASPPAGAGAQYQQIANTSSTGGGGVRQDITGCTPGATYSVGGWFRGNSANSTVTVKVSPSASTSWATATNLSPAATTSGSTWTTFSGTVVATGTNMTLWLDGQTGGTGQNNTACFDALVVTCEEMPPGQPPTLTQQPAGQNVCAGANASFTVAATGQGTLSYQWRTNGVNLSNGSHYAGVTATTLWVTNVSSADAVNYSCVVSDQNGSTTSSNAALTLKAATGFTQHPAATNVCPGGTTTLTVVAVGDGTLTYQWQKNTTNISNGGHYSGATTATLTITGADANDAANYRCVATAGCGSSTSFQGALTVRAATAITQQPSAQNVCPGTTTGFSVAATGDGTLTYRWQTNGVNLNNGSHYAGCTTTLLWVTNAQSVDAVNYRCVVTGGCGSANSSPAALTLKAVTTITGQPVSRQVSAGGTTNFTVSATGDGPLTYQWQKNSVNLTNGGHYAGVTTATLTISSASSADTASYRCVVTGGCGNATSSQAGLTVCNAATLLNPSFELSNVSGVATNWTGYQRAPNPTTVWSIQTASPPAGSGTNYQQIANTSSTGGGGVRQVIKNCVIGATYTVAGWMRGNSGLYSTCTVKVSPTASTSWATAINLNPPATFTGSTWTNFSGTVVATGTNMTLWLDGQTGSTGLNKAECFDAITVTCTP